jgi:hypothetical protein
MKKNTRIILIFVLATLINKTFSQIPKVTFEGKSYYVDVRTSKDRADIWFTEKNNASSAGDKLMMKLNVKSLSEKDAIKLLCDGKKTFDEGKAVIGCMSVAGSVGCLMAMSITGASPIVLCESTLVYASTKGAKDCVLGISDAIADKLKKDSQWNGAKIIKGFSEEKYKDVIDTAIDQLCKLNNN